MCSTQKAATLLAFIILLALACKNEPTTKAADRTNGYTKDLKSKQDSLFQEVMDGHDVAMAKMGQISGYLKNLKSSIDSARNQKGADKQKIAIMESISADLNQADFSMNRWMEEFKLDSAENNEPVRIAYLESERDKVNKIKERVLNSVKRADSLYGK